VHGIALSKGNSKAPSCIDCHTSHEVNGPKVSISTVNKFNIPKTCSKCHSEIAKEYAQSIHGTSVAKGNQDAPVCTDCHGEHNILKHDDPRSPVAYKNLSAQVCSPCHSSVKLTAKYGMDADRFKTFSESYHGLALEGGSYAVANCSSCHGFHNIKPSSDPTSMVNKANLSKTCGKCHPGANTNFTVGSIHVKVTKKDEPILYFIVTLYLILIALTIGAMFLHNFLDFLKKARHKLAIDKRIYKRPTGELALHIVDEHGRSIPARIAVLGGVQQPGYYDLPDGKGTTLADALGLAKGANKRAHLDNVALVRTVAGKQVVSKVDLHRFLAKGDLSQNPTVSAGDVVYVTDGSSIEPSSILSAITSLASPLLYTFIKP